MSDLIGAEILKLRSTRTFYALVLSALGLVVLVVAGISAAADFEGASEPGRELLSIAELAQTFALVLGVLAVTTEFRHGTITPTLLVIPRRGRLVAAKLGAHLIAGLALGLIAFGVAAAVALPVLSLRDVPSELGAVEVARAIGGGAAAAALLAGLGVGVGAVLRHQVGAIIAVFAWLLMIEPLLTAIPSAGEAIDRFGLGGLMAGVSDSTALDAEAEVLAQLPAALVLAAYVLVFAAAGAMLLRRRDVTA